MKSRITILLCAVVMTAVAMDSVAQIQIGGIMRDEYSLGLTPSIKSAGMGGAYVAVDKNFSMNPAALGGIQGIEGTMSYGFYDHDAGPSGHRGKMDVAFKNPLASVVTEWFPVLEFLNTNGIRLMLDGVGSDGAGTSKLRDAAGNPMDIDFDSMTFGMHSGVDICDWLSIGSGMYPYEKSNVELTGPGGKLDGEGLSQFGSMQYGAIVRPCDFIHFGAEFIYIKDDLEVNTPAGHMGDYFYINYFALGAAIMPFDGTIIAVDYWNGEIEGSIDNTTRFDQDVDRWNVGVQQKVCDYCDLRVGSNNGGLTAGATFHINENMELDYAYVNQALRDKENIFGDTQYHGISFTARF